MAELLEAWIALCRWWLFTAGPIVLALLLVALVAGSGLVGIVRLLRGGHG